jgi:hypothetical protein
MLAPSRLCSDEEAEAEVTRIAQSKRAGHRHVEHETHGEPGVYGRWPRWIAPSTDGVPEPPVPTVQRKYIYLDGLGKPARYEFVRDLPLDRVLPAALHVSRKDQGCLARPSSRPLPRPEKSGDSGPKLRREFSEIF